MRVRNLAVNQRNEPRPSRENAKKVAAVEMGLKMAAEKRRKSSALAVSPNSLILAPSPTKTGLKSKVSSIKKRKTPSILPTDQFGTPSGPIQFPDNNDADMFSSEMGQTPLGNNLSSAAPSSSSLSKTSGSMKPKKGQLTAKQRLGKILKLKF